MKSYQQGIVDCLNLIHEIEKELGHLHLDALIAEKINKNGVKSIHMKEQQIFFIEGKFGLYDKKGNRI